MNSLAVRAARPEELGTVAALLEGAELPVAGLKGTDLFVEARRRGLRAAFGLTTTILELFVRHGFILVSRPELPAELEASAELRGACPASAQAFQKDLR